MGVKAILLLAFVSGSGPNLGELLDVGVRLGIGGKQAVGQHGHVHRLEEDRYVICYELVKKRKCEEGTELELRAKAKKEMDAAVE